MRSPRSSRRRKGRSTPKHFIVRQVEGDSMAPTLTAGQLVIGKHTTDFQAGDVVIISHNGMEKIKRIDKQQGNVLYLLGDNSGSSTDSRDFGWVSAKYVLAKVIWPKL